MRKRKRFVNKVSVNVSKQLRCMTLELTTLFVAIISLAVRVLFQVHQDVYAQTVGQCLRSNMKRDTFLLPSCCISSVGRALGGLWERQFWKPSKTSPPSMAAPYSTYLSAYFRTDLLLISKARFFHLLHLQLDHPV